MFFSIQNSLRFISTSPSCHKSYFSKPTEIARWALCDLAATSSSQAICFYGKRYEQFLLDGFTHFFPEISGNVDWSPSLDLASSFSSWMPSKSESTSSLRTWMANGNFATGAFTLVGLILAVIGFVLTSVTTAFSALQIAGLSLMTLSVVLTCGASLLKVCSIAEKIFKANRNIRWLSQQVKGQSIFLKSNYTNSARLDLGRDCEATVRTLSALFSLSANREALLGYKYYRALLIQALAEQIISLLLVTSIVLLFIFAGVFGITALPTIVMGGVAILFGICVMAASVRTMLTLIGEKGHQCKHHIQKAWENAVCSEELLRDPKDLLSERFSILSDSGRHPVYLSLCMRLFKGGTLLNVDEVQLLQNSLSTLNHHLRIDARAGKNEREGLAEWISALSEDYTFAPKYDRNNLGRALSVDDKEAVESHTESSLAGAFEAPINRGDSCFAGGLVEFESVEGGGVNSSEPAFSTAALGSLFISAQKSGNTGTISGSNRVLSIEEIFNTRSFQTVATDDDKAETDSDDESDQQEQEEGDSKQENNKKK